MRRLLLCAALALGCLAVVSITGCDTAAAQPWGGAEALQHNKGEKSGRRVEAVLRGVASARRLLSAPSGQSSTYALTSGLQATSKGLAGTLAQQRSTQPELGADMSPLALNVENVDSTTLRVKIGAPGRWEVPRSLLRGTVNTLEAATLAAERVHDALLLPGVPSEPGLRGADSADPLYQFNYNAAPFGFGVSRKGSSDTTPLFSTRGSRLVFKDQYIEISTSLPASASLYGLGESVRTGGFELPRNGTVQTMWARDSPAAQPNQNVYSAWPFYLHVQSDGLAHGVLLLNSNGMDVVLAETQLTFRVVGGVIDLYFLMGPSPLAVMDQLTRLIGRPALPAYWALGLMNSKYGYQSVAEYQSIVDGYSNAGIPLETFVSDSQYMNHDQDFTDDDTFAPEEMQAFVARLHSKGQRWVPILDPGIHVKPGYAPYESGIKQGVFVRDINEQPFVGQVWPGAVHFPDFASPQAIAWWQQQLATLHGGLPFDGLWLDMNEVSSYCTGDVCSGSPPAANDFVCKLTCQSGPSAAGNGNRSSLPAAGIFNPPYAIGNGQTNLAISTKTLPVTKRHWNGALEYDMHNLYGHTMATATHAALQAVNGKRPFILTRSTWLGTGAVAAHWTGDTASRWEDFRWSIQSILEGGMAGISFIGADICGFMDYPTEELCARWAAAGAWEPYARAHHANGFAELFRWPAVATVAKASFGWRLRMLPYTYTAFHDASASGCPVARPLFMAFPSDATTRSNNRQWMLGNALMVAPVLDQGATAVRAYFPRGTWYSLYDRSTIDASAGGVTSSVTAALTSPAPVFVLGGSVIALGAQGSNLTSQARAAGLTLLAAFPRSGASPAAQCGTCRSSGALSSGDASACGHMYLDNGEELAASGNQLDFSAQLQAAGSGMRGSLSATWAASGGCAKVAWPRLTSVVILGVGPVDVPTVSVTVSPAAGSTAQPVQSFAAMAGSAMQNGMAALAAGAQVKFGAASYDAATHSLTITGLNHQLACPEEVHITWDCEPLSGAVPASATPQAATAG
ncbi:hypothetical protein WJX81_003869 [Elliptochloris bilobata]|uniref:Maltase n=1 Tax=Elliptochloris bilobata TaxID=381761 RepID=A0AAW1RNQ3_9CHLO